MFTLTAEQKTSVEKTGRFTHTPDQRTAVDAHHRAYCQRIWATADAATREQLLAAAWFVR